MTIAPIVEAVPAGTWASDSIHSTVGFAVRHMGLAPFRGGFKDFDATISDGRLVGSARVESCPRSRQTPRICSLKFPRVDVRRPAS